MREGVRVALITGRPLATAQTMVGIDNAAYAANHGLEYWLDGRVELTEGVERYAALVERIVSDATHLEAVGVQIESKGLGVAFHYRRAPDAEAARVAILQAIDSSAAQHFAISGEQRDCDMYTGRAVGGKWDPLRWRRPDGPRYVSSSQEFA